MMMFSSPADKIEKAVSEARHCCHRVHRRTWVEATDHSGVWGSTATACYSHSVPYGQGRELRKRGFGCVSVRVRPGEHRSGSCIAGRIESWLSTRGVINHIKLVNACVQLTFSFVDSLAS